jgi:hypothetical protein
MSKNELDLSQHPIQKIAQEMADSGDFAMFCVILSKDGSDASVSRVLPNTPKDGEELTEEQVNENMVMAVGLADLAITWLPVKELLAMQDAGKKEVAEG